MNVQELRQLLQELLLVLGQVNASGEVLSDEFQGQIAQTLQLLVDRINQGEITPQPIPQMDQAMPSSNVNGYKYDPARRRLYVQFLGKHPNRNGPVYSYQNVPPVIYELFRMGSAAARTEGRNRWGNWWRGKSPSMGASVYTLLRLAGFPYQRLT